ncbi:hypothetical protein FJ981_04555 [Mesorhizobium sp. B1-1-4]|uniref:hypothetical protein n=1 Tax=Mesorhizobium sp. B1-1-4 TaxID=2589980 RepID=UPI00112D3E90|nr:hypothetical protein [Mesorhizobium sp. B1-1-4]TPN59645.1 hypothetical protein FJ981_04555 [Mesorhizobium sp. B1-1-4]
MFTFQGRREFNLLMAACIGFEKGLLEDVCLCFAAAILEEFPSLCITTEDIFDRSCTEDIRKALIEDDGVIESFSFRYVSELESRGLGSAIEIDPDLLAEYISSTYFDTRTVSIEGSEKFYASDRIQINRYIESKLWALAPVNFVLERSCVSISQFLSARTAYENMRHQDALSFATLEGFSEAEDWRNALLRFFSLNDPQRISADKVTGTARSLAKICPLITIKAKNQRLEQLFQADGLFDEHAERIQLRFRDDELIGYFSADGNELDVETSTELLAKSYLIRRQRETYTHGIPTSIYEPLRVLLGARQQVTSVHDLRRMWGLPDIKVDPFALLPGPIVVYAPGRRFLRSGKVSFALRDWVETQENRRARIAKIRILTPLRPMLSTTSHDWVTRALSQDSLWKWFGITSILHRRFIEVPFFPNESVWVIERTKRDVKRILEGEGHRCFNNLVFERYRWEGWHFPPAPNAHWRDQVVEYARQIMPAGAGPPLEIAEQLRLLSSLVGSRLFK